MDNRIGDEMLKKHKNPNQPKFYRFKQNFIGREYVINESVCPLVIIESSCYAFANAIAQELGAYFDTYQGNDCHCCGYRWVPMNSDEDGDDKPLDDEVNYYPKEVKTGEVYIRIYYLNGDVDEYIKD